MVASVKTPYSWKKGIRIELGLDPFPMDNPGPHIDWEYRAASTLGWACMCGAIMVLWVLLAIQ